LIEILDLINENSHRALSVFGCFGDGDKKIGQVDFQVSAISRSLLRIDVQPDSNVVVGDLESTEEIGVADEEAFFVVVGVIKT